MEQVKLKGPHWVCYEGLDGDLGEAISHAETVLDGPSQSAIL